MKSLGMDPEVNWANQELKEYQIRGEAARLATELASLSEINKIIQELKKYKSPELIKTL